MPSSAQNVEIALTMRKTLVSLKSQLLRLVVTYGEVETLFSVNRKVVSAYNALSKAISQLTVPTKASEDKTEETPSLE